jgi:hypothetical protein
VPLETIEDIVAIKYTITVNLAGFIVYYCLNASAGLSTRLFIIGCFFAIYYSRRSSKLVTASIQFQKVKTKQENADNQGTASSLNGGCWLWQWRLLLFPLWY